MGGTDRSVDMLKLFRGEGEGQGLNIIRVVTTDPDPVTFVREGTDLALDPDIFEIPVSAHPLRVDDTFLAYPMVSTGGATRWGLITKLTGGLILGTMQGADSIVLDGMTVTYDASRLILPPFVPVNNAFSKYVDEDTDIHCSGGTSGTTTDTTTTESDEYIKAGAIRPLQSGDRVSVMPTLDGETIKYVVTNRY